MEFGIHIPITVKEDISLDESNGNTLWKDAIRIEMNNSRVAFKLCQKGEKYPVGNNKITCNIIFDLKLDMTQKAQYLEGVQLTDVPKYITYYSVVSHDTVLLDFSRLLQKLRRFSR